MRIIDISGNKFNRLTVISRIKEKGAKQVKWLCKCDCGSEVNVTGRDLKNNHTKSCGCLKMELLLKRSIIHGASKSVEHKAWAEMKSRCLNKNIKLFNYYGGRGIKVCDRWINSFENFLADMGYRPSKKHRLDRFPDNDGNYEPSNCRWATMKEQCSNRRSNRMIEHDGYIDTMTYWANILGIKAGSLHHYLKKQTLDEIFISLKK